MRRKVSRSVWLEQAECGGTNSNLACGTELQQQDFVHLYCGECWVQQECVEDVLDGTELKTAFPGARGGFTEVQLKQMFKLRHHLDTCLSYGVISGNIVRVAARYKPTPGSPSMANLHRDNG